MGVSFDYHSNKKLFGRKSEKLRSRMVQRRRREFWEKNWIVNKENGENLDLPNMKFFVQDSPISTHFLQLLPFRHLFRNINTTSPFLVFRLHSGILGLLPRRFCFRVDPSILLSFHPLVTSFLLFSFSSLRTSRSICLFFQRISQPTRLKSWTIFSVMARIDLINADRHHGWLD